MSNIFTQVISPEFTKQNVTEFFVEPMFMGEDIRGAITIRTDIKGTEKLNRISRPTMITKPKIGPGFSPSGTFALTTQDITVKPMAIEFEQNGREFWGSVVQQLLASGYREDDVEEMKNPDIWNKIVLPIIAQAGQKDLIRQMWFSNPSASALDADYKPTGILDPNYIGYTGFFTHFIQDLKGNKISASQHIAVPTESSGTKQAVNLTLTITDSPSSVFIKINDRTFEQAFVTDAETTIINWLAAHKAIIESLWAEHAVSVENIAPGTIKIEAAFAGAKFSYDSGLVGGAGDWAVSNVVEAVAPGALVADGADATLEQMLDNMPNELLELDPVFMISRSMYRNLFKTWKSLGTETANQLAFRGLSVPSYEGIPILVRPDWDVWDKALGGVLPNRALLTTQKNLLFATDGTSDSDMIETWYNQDEQMRRYRVQYKAQTAYLHKELIVLAGLK